MVNCPRNRRVAPFSRTTAFWSAGRTPEASCPGKGADTAILGTVLVLLLRLIFQHVQLHLHQTCEAREWINEIPTVPSCVWCVCVCVCVYVCFIFSYSTNLMWMLCVGGGCVVACARRAWRVCVVGEVCVHVCACVQGVRCVSVVHVCVCE